MGRFTILVYLTGLFGLSACSSSLHEQPFAYNESVQALNRSNALADTSFRIVYPFGKTTDDASGPYPAPIAVSGTFYGSTSYGGKSGDGTVYSISPSGVETVLHSFKGTDGKTPWSALLYNNGALYGSTLYGGTNNDGTIYRITPRGSFKLLHSFRGGKRDGTNPVGALVALNGTLYGTTGAGGPYNQKNGGYGTAFSITTDGSERILHYFQGPPDGAGPWGTLTVVKGMLYGTTTFGGKHFAGSVFRITTSGSVELLHSFTGPDGEQPEANLLYQNGSLYGTSTKGGSNGFGTIFKVGLGGKYATLYSFAGASDGCHPTSGLLSVNGNLFGLTTGGWPGSSCSSFGTIYALSSSGSLTTVHTFDGRNGGAEPMDFSGLTSFGGRLLGTTWTGGDNKVGVLFSIAP